MLTEEFLAMIRCPENRTPLRVADEQMLRRLNAAVSRGSLKNRAGQVVEKPLTAGLLREDSLVLYPIIDEIPILLMDEGILLDQLGSAS